MVVKMVPEVAQMPRGYQYLIYQMFMVFVVCKYVFQNIGNQAPLIRIATICTIMTGVTNILNLNDKSYFSMMFLRAVERKRYRRGLIKLDR